MYVEFKESTQRISTKNIYKEFPQNNSRKLFDKVQISVFKMILMNKWFSDFFTLKTKCFNDLIFLWFYLIFAKLFTQTFRQSSVYVFTLKTKYSQNNFRQSSRIAKFSNKIFSKVKTQNLQEFKHKALLNLGWNLQ